ncbi:MAG: peptidoglycan DD-metalloendopeptidase family protein [Gemmiger sp.]
MSEKQQPKTTAAGNGSGAARENRAAVLSETERAVEELLNALQELSGDTMKEHQEKAALPESPATAVEKTDKAKAPSRKRAPARTKAPAGTAAGETKAKKASRAKAAETAEEKTKTKAPSRAKSKTASAGAATKAETAEKAPARRKTPARKKATEQDAAAPVLPASGAELPAAQNPAAAPQPAAVQVLPAAPQPPVEKERTVELPVEPEQSAPPAISALSAEKPDPEPPVQPPEAPHESAEKPDPEPPAQPPEAPQEPAEKPEPEPPVQPSEAPQESAEKPDPEPPVQPPEAPGEKAVSVEKQPDEQEPDEQEPSEEERQRLIDMTRTVQISIEQIMARTAGQPAAAPPKPEPEPEPESDHHEQPLWEALADRLTGSAVRLARWAALVLFLVLVIAGAGLAWLYRGATPDALPQITVTLSGHTLEASAYRWKVPVVGSVLQRTFAQTLHTEPAVLEEPLVTTHPILVIQPTGLEASLTVCDAGGTEVFAGTPEELRDRGLPGNGEYQAKLTVTKPADRFADGNSVSGSQSYLFDFSVGMQPSLRLSAASVSQGGVVTVQVTNVQGEDVPVLSGEWETTGFRKGQNGWVAYLPIPCDAEPGTYTLGVTVGSFTGELTLTVRAVSWQSSEVYGASSLVTPYLSLADTPAEVRDVLDVQDEAAAWAEKGFVQPFLKTVTVTLPYGAVESVRSTGARRTATNAVVKTRWGASLIAPADGRVLLAGDLGGTAGNTVVIEHGAGVKSIFYCLASLDVTRGDTVRQGQSIGTANGAMIAEVRVGQVPVEPFAVWRNQCNALKIN